MYWRASKSTQESTTRFFSETLVELLKNLMKPDRLGFWKPQVF